jgi:hypothetical protein
MRRENDRGKTPQSLVRYGLQFVAPFDLFWEFTVVGVLHGGQEIFGKAKNMDYTRRMVLNRVQEGSRLVPDWGEVVWSMEPLWDGLLYIR